MNWLPALAVALTFGAPGPKDAPKKAEPPGIVGEWECVEFIGGGRRAAPNEVARIGIEFTADGKCRHREGEREASEGTYSIDPRKSPVEIDFHSGQNTKGNKGIYKVEKDTLVICMTEGGGDRPTKLESPAGTRIMLVTFKRVEKKKE